MLGFIARRVLTMVLTALCLTFVVFALTNLQPNLEKIAKARPAHASRRRSRVLARQERLRRPDPRPLRRVAGRPARLDAHGGRRRDGPLRGGGQRRAAPLLRHPPGRLGHVHGVPHARGRRRGAGARAHGQAHVLGHGRHGAGCARRRACSPGMRGGSRHRPRLLGRGVYLHHGQRPVCLGVVFVAGLPVLGAGGSSGHPARTTSPWRTPTVQTSAPPRASTIALYGPGLLARIDPRRAWPR
jgi:hypothetical protein